MKTSSLAAALYLLAPVVSAQDIVNNPSSSAASQEESTIVAVANRRTSYSSALLQQADEDEHSMIIGRRGLGRSTSREKKKKRMFSTSSDDVAPPFTNPKPKDICVQELQAYTIRGESTPIVGKTGLSFDISACFIDPLNGAGVIGNVNPACTGILAASYPCLTFQEDLAADSPPYLSCLATKEAGPVIIGKWWFNRDVNFGSFAFENGAVVAAIDSTDSSSRTKFDLWEQRLIGMPLGEFNEFSVEYDIRSRATLATVGSFRSDAYVNLYLRVADNMEFYDCRLDYLADPSLFSTGGMIVIDPETVASPNPRTSTTYTGPGCGGANTITGFLTEFSTAVMGVGNSELYAFTLDTGSTNQNDDGLVVAWSNVLLSTTDSVTGDTQLDGYKFKPLK